MQYCNRISRGLEVDAVVLDAGVGQRVGLAPPQAHPSWLSSSAAAVDHHSSVLDTLKMMSFDGSSKFDGDRSNLIQDMNKMRDMSEYCSPYNVENSLDFDIPGGPVNLVDCRRTRIRKLHSEEEKRERKLVLARLRQRRFRERMKRIKDVHSGGSFQPIFQTSNLN